jgi:hypothetical protein
MGSTAHTRYQPVHLQSTSLISVQENLRTRKVNVKSALSTPCRHIGRAEVQLHSLLTSALDGREWLTSHTDRSTAMEKNAVSIE